MGDLSAEPSMEEILSSIKRIIAEEGETPGRQRRGGRTPVPPSPAIEEVLELSDPIPATPAAAELSRRAQAAEPAGPSWTAEPEAEASLPSWPEPAEEPVQAPAEEPAIVSRQTADVSRGALESLSRLVVKPEAGSDGTLEGLVRDMLRPMLREWLDRNLPAMVETMVAREIARIAHPRD